MSSIYPETLGDGYNWFVLDEAHIPATVRSFTPGDQSACSALYIDGLLGGRIAENDTGYDIDHIDEAYMRNAGSHFWVAESPSGHIVGTIGVQQYEDGVGEIRRLRVRRDYRRRGIGSLLLETALRFCQERNYLKVTLDTYVEREPALRLFDKFRFKLARTRNVGERELAYFYFDIYSGSIRRHGGAVDLDPADGRAEFAE